MPDILDTIRIEIVGLVALAVGGIVSWLRSEKFRTSAVGAFVFLVRSLLPADEKDSVGHQDLNAAIALTWARYEMSPIGHMFMDADGHVLRTNRALCDLLNVEERELTGDKWLTYIESTDLRIVTGKHMADWRHLITRPG